MRNVRPIAFRTTGRFPLVRVPILPALDVLFARTAAELLFDRIRRIHPPGGLAGP